MLFGKQTEIGTYQQIPQEHDNGNLADGGHVYGRLLLDLGREVALAGKVDAHSAVLQQVHWHLVLVARNAADDDVADGQAVLDSAAGLFIDFVPPLSQPHASCEDLHIGNVDAVHVRAVVGQQRSQRPAYNLAPVYDGDGTPVQPVSVRQYRIVYAQVLEDLDDCERGARQHALLRVRDVEEADVLVHVEDVLVGEALDILVDGDDLLQVLVLAVAEDGVVDDDAVDGGVGVGVDEGVFEELAVDFAQFESEAAVWYEYEGLQEQSCTAENAMQRTCSLFVGRLARPLGVDARGGIRRRQEADEQRLAVNRLQAIVHLGQQALCDIVREHDLAVGLVVGHGGGDGGRCAMLEDRSGKRKSQSPETERSSLGQLGLIVHNVPFPRTTWELPHARFQSIPLHVQQLFFAPHFRHRTTNQRSGVSFVITWVAYRSYLGPRRQSSQRNHTAPRAAQSEHVRHPAVPVGL